MKTNAFPSVRNYLRSHSGHLVTFALSAFIVIGTSVAFALPASAQTYASITAQAGPGATGINVRNIQTFLASTPSFYPEGLVTGYYGTLTQAAVRRFQAYYGIISYGTPASTGYGRVGPSTMAKMNALILGNPTSVDMSAPFIYPVVISPTSSGATISWTTNELATSRLYYSTSPIRFTEGDEFSTGFMVTSGTAAVFDSNTRLSHGTTLSGLSSNTTYYYLIVATDPTGNVSVFLPGATFRTGN